jgi:hypothetical protein
MENVKTRQRGIHHARDTCCIQGITQVEGLKIVTLNGASSKVREVRYDTTTMIANYLIQKTRAAKEAQHRHVPS